MAGILRHHHWSNTDLKKLYMVITIYGILESGNISILIIK